MQKKKKKKKKKNDFRKDVERRVGLMSALFVHSSEK